MPDLATNVLSYGDNLDILRRYLPDAAIDQVSSSRSLRRHRLLLASIAILAASCSSSYQPTPPPTIAETQAFVAQMVRLAQAGEFEQLCKMGGGNCERILATAGAENVPVDPPTVARIYVVPSVVHADGSWSQGGQMVEMCGNERSGAPYQTQMIVFRDREQGVIAIEPIYWSGLSISVDAEQPVGPATHPAFAC